MPFEAIDKILETNIDFVGKTSWQKCGYLSGCQKSSFVPIFIFDKWKIV